MALTREQIVNGYLYLLGREPLPHEIDLWSDVPDIDKLREIFMSSVEFRRKTARSDATQSHTAPEPAEKKAPVRDLIFDIGMSEGNDTAFYLQKGFRVVGVEADPVVYGRLCDRFSKEIAEGRLVALNRVATVDGGKLAEFWRNELHPGLSSTVRRDEVGYREAQTRYDVASVDWSALTAISGVPYYCKIDIEGGESAFLKSMANNDGLPTFISAEAHTFDPILELFVLGYRQFKMIDQNILHSFLPLPNPPLEGTFVAQPNWSHCSGPFGRELPGPRWLTFGEVTELFWTLKRLRELRTVSWTWFDVHAYMPEAV